MAGHGGSRRPTSAGGSFLLARREVRDDAFADRGAPGTGPNGAWPDTLLATDLGSFFRARDAVVTRTIAVWGEPHAPTSELVAGGLLARLHHSLRVAVRQRGTVLTAALECSDARSWRDRGLGGVRDLALPSDEDELRDPTDPAAGGHLDAPPGTVLRLRGPLALEAERSADGALVVSDRRGEIAGIVGDRVDLAPGAGADAVAGALLLAAFAGALPAALPAALPPG